MYLIDGATIFEPEDFKRMQRSGIGHTMQFRQGGPTYDRFVPWSDNNFRRDISAIFTINFQISVAGIFLLTNLRISCSSSVKRKIRVCKMKKRVSNGIQILNAL